MKNMRVISGRSAQRDACPSKNLCENTVDTSRFVVTCDCALLEFFLCKRMPPLQHWLILSGLRVAFVVAKVADYGSLVLIRCHFYQIFRSITGATTQNALQIGQEMAQGVDVGTS